MNYYLIYFRTQTCCSLNSSPTFASDCNPALRLNNRINWTRFLCIYKLDGSKIENLFIGVRIINILFVHKKICHFAIFSIHQKYSTFFLKILLFIIQFHNYLLFIKKLFLPLTTYHMLGLFFTQKILTNNFIKIRVYQK